MRSISLEVLNELTKRWEYPFRCCLCGHSPAQLHHNLIFGGSQVDEPWAILPVCHTCHQKADEKETRERLDRIMFDRATNAELEPYSKIVDLVAKKQAVKPL